MTTDQRVQLLMIAIEKSNKLERDRVKNDEQTWRLEIQGKRLTLGRTGYKRFTKMYPVRGCVTEFSRRARARKLRRIAEVRWKDVGEVQFLTVTYPDDVAHHTMTERKNHRYSLNRWLCDQVGRRLPCFWRVEWMPRLSGRLIGQLMPHMHFLYLTCPRICEMRIRLKWMKILGVNQYTQVKIKALEIPEAVGVYVSKYCAKEAPNLLLDNVPKRNRTGRHAGELRAELIPTHAKEVVRRVEEAIVKFLSRRGYETLWWYDPRHDEGFTILGDVALEIIREIHETYLAFPARND